MWHNYCFNERDNKTRANHSMELLKPFIAMPPKSVKYAEPEGVKLEQIISHFSNLVDGSNIHSSEVLEKNEVEKALNLALLAMTEAEKRIERQQKRIKQLEKISVTDELTKLLNRRGFLSQLKSTLSSAKRHEIGGSLVILDLDGFKDINDRFGHTAGDKLLQEVSKCLKRKVRETDTVGRLGGDEFAIILAGLPSPMVSRRVDDIQSAIARLEFEWDGQKAFITASIGRYDYSGRENYTELIDQADLSMYDKKLKKNADKKLALNNEWK